MERLLDADLNASNHVVITSFIIVVTCIQIGIPDVSTLSHLGGGNENLEYSQDVTENVIIKELKGL